MDLLDQSALFLSLASFAIGFSTLSINIKNTLFISFTILTSFISFWSLFFFLKKIFPNYDFYRAHLLCHILLIPAALSFTQVLAKKFTTFGKKIFWFSSSSCILLFFAILFHLDKPFPFITTIIYLSPTFIALQTIELLSKKNQEQKINFKKDETEAGRRNYIYKGALLVLVTSVMDHMPFMGTLIPSIGNFILVGYLYFLSQVIRKQRFLNIGALVSRILVLMILACILTGVYAMLVIWIKDSLGLFMVNSFVASFFLLTLLEPLRGIVSSLTKRFLTQKQLQLQEKIFESQQKLTGIVDLSGLCAAVSFFLEQTLQPEWGYIFILKSEGTRFRRIREIGKPLHHTPREILSNHPLMEYCQQLHKKNFLPIILDQIIENERDRSASRLQKDSYAHLLQGLKGLGCNLIIPFIDTQILGFASLQVHTPPDPWKGNWGLLSIIYPYFEYVAHTIQNMEVYVKQREKERLATIGEMAAGLAHEIRNPLGAIKGAAQLLDPSKDKPDSKFLRVIIDEVDRLNRVVTQFLDYSKPPVVDFQLINLSYLAEKTLQLMQATLAPAIQIEFFPSKIPATIIGNKEQLKQVLINLLQNSAKALEHKTQKLIRVSVSIEFEPNTTEVMMSVEDTGCGIKKENIDKLFIPFFTTSPSGTGLGLSISQKIIESHKGRIEIISEPDRFTKFIILLPYNNKEQRL